MTFTFDSTGEIVIDTLKDEGVGCNGIFVNASSDKRLYQGYGVTLEAGVVDSAKFVMKFYLGQWRGEDADSLLYEGLTKSQAAANPKLILEDTRTCDS